MTNQVWYKPSQIAKDGLILNSRGKPSYRFIMKMIHEGKLKAKVWTQNGKNTEGAEKRDWFMVHIDEIKRFNEEGF